MSWELFKQNILRVANSPEGISDIDVVAESYAKEYDAAVKRGFDRTHSIPLVSGNVELMKTFFKSALQKGLTASQPYDLVGEMGEGVKAYWGGAVMATAPIPIQPAPGSISNIQVSQNIISNVGFWRKPESSANVEPNLDLTPEKRIEYQEGLEDEIVKYNQLIIQQKNYEASASLDAIRKFTAILSENQDYNTEVSVEDAIAGIVPGSLQLPQPSPLNNQPAQTALPTNVSGNQSKSQEEIDEDLSFLLDDSDSFTQDSGETVKGFKWNQGKPFVQGPKPNGGFRAGGSGGAPYVPFTNFKGDATVGERAVAIAVHDASQGIIEGPDDTGHARIIQMQGTANAKWGGGTGFAWCACAVTTWWIEAGFDAENLFKFGPNYKGEMGTTARHFYWPGVPQWVLWAIDTGRYVDMKAKPDHIPKAGDAIIYDWDNSNGASNHIGLFWKIENGKWWGIDGNKGGRGKGAIKAHCIQSMGAVQGIVRI
jgi:hypothetical protein